MTRSRLLRPARAALLPLTCAALLAATADAIKYVPLPALPPAPTAPPSTATPPSPTLPELLPELRPEPPRPAQGVPTLQPLGPAQPAGPALPPLSVPQTPASPSGPYLPPDPLFARQWNLQAIRLPQAWSLTRGVAATPVTVAVLDTGFVTSPELTGRVVNGYDFVSNPARAGDGNGRDPDATAVGEFAYHAEVIGNLIAAAHDGRGMAGINPQARIVQVRVAGVDGMIEVADLVDGMRWAAGLSVPGVPANPTPAKILNLSLYADFIPLTGCDPRVQAALDAVSAKGVLVVAGAANDGTDASGYSPAGCRNVLTVTSVSQEGVRPEYANWGRSVALAAPGGEPGHGVVSASVSGERGERAPDGTSFAAPHVSGVASLLLSVRPKLSVYLLKSYLTRSATPFPGGRCDRLATRTCGSGTLNAEAALKVALGSSLGK